MRSADVMQGSLFTVAKLEDFVPEDHSLRGVLLLAHEVVEGFFAEVLRLADGQCLLSKEHVSVDGTLIQAWATQKSFRPKDSSDDQRPGGGGRNAQADWKGKPRSNDTHI